MLGLGSGLSIGIVSGEAYPPPAKSLVMDNTFLNRKKQNQHITSKNLLPSLSVRYARRLQEIW